MLRLTDHFSGDQVVRDAECSTLGGQRTSVTGILAYAATIHYLRILGANPAISAVITTPSLVESVPQRIGIVSTEDPRTCFYDLHEDLFRRGEYVLIAGGRGSNCRIHPAAEIDDHAEIGDGVKIGAGVVIGANTVVGPDVLIEPGVRIGVEGILYLKGPLGIRRIPHAGGVRIGAGATVLANAVVVRSVHDSLWTEVGDRSVVGIASCIGHEALVGSDCVISGNCVIARNTLLGNEVFVGTNSYIRENLRVGKSAKVMAGAVVVSDVPEGAAVSGNFAIAHERRLKEFTLSRVR